MKPRIDGTASGSITVEGTVFDHDVITRPDGQVKKRKKKLSKAVYGTSHTISFEEVRYMCGQPPRPLRDAGRQYAIPSSAPRALASNPLRKR
jgi:hypothetical protein